MRAAPVSGKRRRRWQRLLGKMRIHIVVLAALMVVGVTVFFLLRMALLQNAQSTGTSLARNYATEERNKLVVFETLLSFGAGSIDTWVEQGWSRDEVQQWLVLYFQRMQAILDEQTVDPYAVIDGEIVAANPWEGDADYDAAQTSWYQQATQAQGAVIFTDVYTDAISGNPVVTMAQQCAQSGAVVAFDIFPENFHFSANAVDVPKGGSFFLCDSLGTLIYQQTQMERDSEEVQGYVRELAREVRLGTYAAYDAQLTDLDGEQRNVYYYFLPNGWLAMLTVPYDTILQGLSSFTAVYALLVLTSLLTVLGLSWRDLRLNEQVERTNETVRVLGNSYYALYRVNFGRNTYEMIKGSDYVRSRIGPSGNYEALRRVVGEVIEPEAYQEYLDSFSIENIRRLVAHRIRDFGGDFRRRFGDEYRWVSVRVLFDESLSPEEVVLCFREVEEEKRHRVEEKKLLENALEASRRSEKAKHAFFSNMSHDMRTPLNAIIGLSELAEQHLEDKEKVAGYLDKIDYSSHQLLELINDILDMSRMEQGKVVLDYQQFDLKACIRDCAEAFRPQAEREKKQLELHLEVRQPRVLGDSFRISQIMNNLLSNAFKFTGAGDTVSVSLTQFDYQEHAKYQIVVRDTGMGMSPDFLPQLFEPYARESRFSARQVSGTGLGMPIVKNLVTQMSGQIHVESAPDQGSTFTVVIPFTALEETAEEEKGPAEAGSTFSLEGRHILLAEDNLVNMEIATEILSMNGVEVTQAWNGREAVDAFEASQPFTFDAVLMDMQMPQMDGCEAARHIRALYRPDAKKIPILAVTANAFAEDVAATGAAGMDAHISKPIDFRILCATLERLIETGR